MKRSIIYFSILLFTAVTVNAQNSQDVDYYKKGGGSQAKFHQMAYLNWDISFPTGNLSNFTGATSYSGGTFGYRKMLSKGNVSIGGDISWHSFSEYKARKTYQLDAGAITTDLYSYVYELPFGVTTHYYFNGGKHFMPYAGLCIGANYSQQDLCYNTYVTSYDNWGLYLRPEIGAVIRFDEYAHWGVLVGAKYNYSTNKTDNFKLDNQSSFGASLGIAWDW